MVTAFTKRPTSPLHLETAAVAPEDILHFAPEDDFTTERHRRKRRRIEELGQQYLEGKPLVILSASFRGPLSNGWANPWAKRRAPTTDGLRDASKESNSRKHRQYPKAASTTQNVDSAHLNYGFYQSALERNHGTEPLNAGGPASSFPEVKAGAAQRTQNQDLKEQPWLSTSVTNGAREPETGGGAPVANMLAPTVSGPPRSSDWLKSDKTYQSACTADNMRSSTPTPNSKPSLPSRHAFGFTPINKPPQAPEKPHLSHCIEIALSKADTTTREGYSGARGLSQQAVAKAVDDDAYLQAKNLSLEAAKRAEQEGTPPDALFPQVDAIRNDQSAAIDDDAPKNPKQKHRPTPHQLPPSTNLAEFQYRLARKKQTSSFEGVVSGESSFAQKLRAAKAMPDAQSVKRLSFTASGATKSFGSKSTSRATSASPKNPPKDPERDVPSEKGSLDTKVASLRNEGSSEARLQERSEPQLPGLEGQQISIPAMPSRDPSDPSMNPFGMTKNLDEDDSYLDLSTQAAISKAQGSLQNGIEISPQYTSKRPNGVITSQPSPTAYKTPKAHSSHIPPSLTIAPDINHKTPDADALSTQAMMDAISPFAVTTMKKPKAPNTPTKSKKRTSFAPSPMVSPSHTFGTTRRSFSMSTSSGSPSPTAEPLVTRRTSLRKPPPPSLSKASTGVSKPPSTATSTAFSIAPNGTLTEVNQQDGQQPHDVGMGMEGWDLDEAIEEAGSFLATGAWDVEAEARKEGSLHAKTNGR